MEQRKPNAKRVDVRTKQHLLELIHTKGYTVKKAATELNIKYGNAININWRYNKKNNAKKKIKEC